MVLDPLGVTIPRSYQVKQAREMMRSTFGGDLKTMETDDTSKSKGKQVPSVREAIISYVRDRLRLGTLKIGDFLRCVSLIAFVLGFHISTFTPFEESQAHTTERLRFHGDGVPVSNSTTMCLLSFGLLDDADILNTEGNSILGVASGKDCYHTWSTCFAEIWKVINELEKEKKLEVDGVIYDVECFLGESILFSSSFFSSCTH